MQQRQRHRPSHERRPIRNKKTRSKTFVSGVTRPPAQSVVSSYFLISRHSYYVLHLSVLIRVVLSLHIRSRPRTTTLRAPACTYSIRVPSSIRSLSRSFGDRTSLFESKFGAVLAGPDGFTDKIWCGSTAVWPLCCCSNDGNWRGGGLGGKVSELSATGLFAWLYCVSARRRISLSLFSTSIASRAPSQRVRFLCLLQGCIEDFRFDVPR